MPKRKWTKLPPIKKGELHIGCLNCSTAEYQASMDHLIGSGFGFAALLKDGDVVFDGDSVYEETGQYPSFAEAEAEAAKDPNHDWQVVIDTPLHGETYQRHGKNKWICVESNRGFA